MFSTNRNNQERTCPVCATTSYVHFANERIDPGEISEFTYASRKNPEFMRLRLVRCVHCDLVYAPTPPQKDFLTTAYSDAAYDSGLEAQAAANSYAKALAPFILRLVGRTAAVDVGAGSGPLLPWLRTCGFNSVIGIEPSRAAIECAPPTVRPLLKEGMFSPGLLADLRTSLLCSFMTLEHMADPGEFVGDAYDLLEPGGILAVIVHNWRAPLNRLLGLRSPIMDIEHLQLFSPQSMRMLMAKSGFESIHLKPIKNAYPLRYWLRLTPLPGVVKNRIAEILDSIRLSDLQIPLRVGNMLAVGVKSIEKKQ
uniref:Methyltransferase domain-containing protein n=1 Tax=Candidatus Kentrum sp. LPFa TaxID=2126335 RepID=A0A450X997_9GAMM|nr:MAG: Methyltransferase domain-containing protein [Candidatus Kentron sp. LPFa]VFK25771.1 MAG: Methyltransferase domain-containing protein [Candidatus Kentron sp. LPFa]